MNATAVQDRSALAPPAESSSGANASPPNLKMTEKVKVTFQLPRADLELLQAIAAEDAVSVTEALRRAIRTEVMLRKQFEEGFRLVLVSADKKTQRELVRW
ncbi:ribbon-helix-helix protein, CopG family [Deinococcus hohokamensis]|uniref:Ribbon-helix-helix protein, CopG family n=1 Tax=Deinococcus hohokamensis TaxID=309883 RepID=A0ABV9I683_9DEIO